jgi:hypothetical protein
MGFFGIGRKSVGKPDVELGKLSTACMMLESLEKMKVVKIAIVTTDRGPVEDDVFWRFQCKDGSFISLSQSDPKSDEILEICQKLDRFDNEALIRSMTSADNAVFQLWSRAE